MAEFNVIEGNVETVHLIDGTKIGCDTLVCAVPPMKLAKLLNVDLSNFSFSKPSDIILVHFVVKGGIETSAYFHYNYDNNYYSFRSTFYNNFSDRPHNRNHVTVEIRKDITSLSEKEFSEIIFNELKRTGLVDVKATVETFKVQVMKNSLVKQSLDLPKFQRAMKRHFEERVVNLKIVNPTVEKICLWR